jgi:H+/Cl- antiporter ClcA
MIFEIANAVDITMWDSVFGWENMEFWDFILLIISLFVLTAGLLSIIFILWWWLLLILSWGKDDKIKPAINTIRYSVIWVVVTVLTIFLFPIFGRLLWLDVEKYAEPKRIFEKIWQIWDQIFWNSGNSSEIIGDWVNGLDEFADDFSDL